MSDPANYRCVLVARTEEASDGLVVADPGDGESAGLIRIEVEPDPAFQGDAGLAEVLERFTDRVDELGAAVGVVAERLRVALEHRFANDEVGRWRMSQVGMEFGLNLEAGVGIIVCKGKTAAAFKVSITWTQRDGDGSEALL